MPTILTKGRKIESFDNNKYVTLRGQAIRDELERRRQKASEEYKQKLLQGTVVASDLHRYRRKTERIDNVNKDISDPDFQGHFQRMLTHKGVCHALSTLWIAHMSRNMTVGLEDSRDIATRDQKDLLKSNVTRVLFKKSDALQKGERELDDKYNLIAERDDTVSGVFQPNDPSSFEQNLKKFVRQLRATAYLCYRFTFTSSAGAHTTALYYDLDQNEFRFLDPNLGLYSYVQEFDLVDDIKAMFYGVEPFYGAHTNHGKYLFEKVTLKS